LLNIFTADSLIYCLLDPRFKHLPFVSADNPQYDKAQQQLVNLLACEDMDLSRPTTSVPCERFWLEAGNIVSDKRSSLDQDSVCMLVVTEHTLRELERIGKPFTELFLSMPKYSSVNHLRSFGTFISDPEALISFLFFVKKNY